MASAVIYAPSNTYSVQEYDGYPYDDRRPEYTPYPSSRPLPQPAQQQQAHQFWAAPPRSSTISHRDPSIFVSPPPLRRSLADDPAFATDPNINPEYWHIQMNVQSTTPFPSRSYSGLDLTHDFGLPQSGTVSNTSPRGHSYHDEDTRPVYFVPPSISSSSSASDSSASKSSNVRPPRSSVRNSDYAPERSPFRSDPPMEVQYALPYEGQSQSRNGKHKRRSPHSARPAKDHAASHAEAAGGTIIPSTPLRLADGASRPLMSSMTIPSPPDVSEHPKDSRVRTSSRPTPPDLDTIDELDKTNPLGVNLHHKGPYEAVAAILNETNPIDSPVLRQKRAQKQVSSGTRPVRPSRHIKSEPNANPMSLNLQPGQILPNSIYQPTQPSHFPTEFGRRTHPPSQDLRVPRKPVEYPAADYDTANTGSPLRRNQTLPVPSTARGTSGQFYQEPPPVTSEVPPYQHPYHADSSFHQRNLPQPLPIDSVPSRSSGRHRMSQISKQPSMSPYAPPSSYSHPPQSTGVDHAVAHHSPYADMSHNSGSPSQIAPVASVGPPEAPPYPDLDQHFSHTLYLTNPDEAHGASDHRPHGHLLPTAPEMVHPPSERRSERPRRSHHSSLYGGQPSLAAPRPTEPEGRRRHASRGSPPTTGRTPEQDSSRRYEPPSQTLAAINAQYVSKAPSTSSSSRTSSSLAPRHVPKHLVMPTPLANASESAPPTPPSAAVISRGNARRSGQGQVLRKRNSRVETQRPQRPQSLPPQTVKGGIFSFFKFGKGSKPTVREVRFSEPPKVGMNEQGEQRGRTREEPRTRKLSKRR
ncbi:hypothetical protein F5888DRAFT_1643866 [Russula emetica]|nr:hypothetical protein F5888DRAFT_1643866 [Russula emetica]